MGIEVHKCYSLKRQLFGAYGTVYKRQGFIMILHYVDGQLADQYTHLVLFLHCMIGGAHGVANSVRSAPPSRNCSTLWSLT